MFLNSPNTPRNRIAATIAIVVGLVVGFYFVYSDKGEGAPVEVSEAEIDLEGSVISDFQYPEVPTPPESLRLEDIDFAAYSEDLAQFTGLKIGQSRIEAIDNVRLHFAPGEGDNMIRTSQSVFEREDGAVMIYRASGLADDSVKAEEIYLIVTGPKGAQTLASFGSRIKCYRGENTTEWQTAFCP